MSRSRIPQHTVAIVVCETCMLMHANGEIGPDHSGPAPWSMLRPFETVTMGDTDGLGYMTVSCDGCGTSDHGDRWEFTLWIPNVRIIREAHRLALSCARSAGTPGAAMSHLEYAGTARRELSRVKANLARRIAHNVAEHAGYVRESRIARMSGDRRRAAFMLTLASWCRESVSDDRARLAV